MKKLFWTFLFCSASLFVLGETSKEKKANKDTDNWRYEIQCAGTGAEGTYLVKVSSYSKKQSVATEQAKKNAVHGVIFKGISGKPGECSSQKPLAKSPAIEQEQHDFFYKFFGPEGDYMKYVSLTQNSDVAKVGKEYKVSVIVSVSKDQLRKDLEAAGIIKGLGSGF